MGLVRSFALAFGYGQPEFAQCVDRLVECRVCKMLNAMDDLSTNCDAFDDGVLNASCQ